MRFFRTKREKAIKLYQKGYRKGVEHTEREKNLEIKALRQKANKMIAEKTAEVRRLTSHIDSIESSLDSLLHLASQMKHIGMRIEDEKQIELLEVTRKYKLQQGFAGELVLAASRIEKRVPRVVEKIERRKLNL